MSQTPQTTGFSPEEIRQFREIGVNLPAQCSEADIVEAFTTWVNTLHDEKPDLLEKIALAMAEARGVKPPPRLSVVRADEPPVQS